MRPGIAWIVVMGAVLGLGCAADQEDRGGPTTADDGAETLDEAAVPGDGVSVFHRGCATPEVSALERADVERDLARRPGTPRAGGVIPVHVHVIQGSTTGGAVSDAAITAQLGVLNDAFGPFGFTFVHASTDRVVNRTWSTMTAGSRSERQAKAALHRGDAGELNLYTAGQGVRMDAAWAAYRL